MFFVLFFTIKFVNSILCKFSRRHAWYILCKKVYISGDLFNFKWNIFYTHKNWNIISFIPLFKVCQWQLLGICQPDVFSRPACRKTPRVIHPCTSLCCCWWRMFRDHQHLLRSLRHELYHRLVCCRVCTWLHKPRWHCCMQVGYKNYSK